LCLTSYWTTEFDPRQRQIIFPLVSVSKPALGPTQSPMQWVPGSPLPGVKSGRGVKLTAHPHLVSRSRMSRSCSTSPPWRLYGVAGQFYLLFTLHVIVIFVLCFRQLSSLNPTLLSITSTLLWLGDRGSIPGIDERIFPLASVSRPALWPTQPPIQWVLGIPSPGVKLGRVVTLTTHPI
jgi:hypothetical protein